MKIILNNSSMLPIYEQIVGQIKSQILDGKLLTGTLLPSVRALSGELRISALTVKKAYDALEAEGFVVTVHGKGTYVKAADVRLVAEQRRKKVEDQFAEAVDKAKALGMSAEEIKEIVSILLESDGYSNDQN